MHRKCSSEDERELLVHEVWVLPREGDVLFHPHDDSHSARLDVANGDAALVHLDEGGDSAIDPAALDVNVLGEHQACSDFQYEAVRPPLWVVSLQTCLLPVRDAAVDTVGVDCFDRVELCVEGL